MKILYVGPFRDCSGYATAARDYLNALHSVGADIAARTIKFDAQDYPLTDLEKELHSKDVSGIDVIIQHTTPNTSKPKHGVKNLLYMAWETSLIPKSWKDPINAFDAVMVPCEMNVTALKDSGVTIPVHKVPHTFDLSKYEGPRQPKQLDVLKDKFVFYNICQLTKKKGIDRLLMAYFTEFRHDEPVGLMLKVYVNANFGQDDTQQVRQYIETIKNGLKLNKYPKVYANTQILTERQILDMHKQFDCYVGPSRGEGWNLGAFEAMASGTPTLVTNWGGPCEYMDGCTPINYHLENVIGVSHVFEDHYTGRELWAVPDIMSLKSKMRKAFSFGEGCIEPTGIEQAKRFSYDKIGCKMLDIVEGVHNEKVSV